MYQVIPCDLKTESTRFSAPPGLPALDPAALDRQRPDAAWLVLDERETVVGRGSAWWRHVPAYPGRRLGLIGHYAAANDEAAGHLLRQGCAELAGQGCTLAVGPMDGNTWQPYRLLTWRGAEPVFFLEPDNPDDWPGHFTAAGFQPLAGYSSALTTYLGQPDAALDRVARRAAGRGITIRSLNPAGFEAELARIYHVAVAAFAHNFLYTPIEEADFIAQYRPLRPYLRPELVLLAEQAGRLLGFIFALPDLLQARRGQPVDTIIIKTIAVRPEAEAAGLGAVLAAHCHAIAADLGYRRVIHALMHETNDSRRASARHQASIIRRYALFARGL